MTPKHTTLFTLTRHFNLLTLVTGMLLATLPALAAAQDALPVPDLKSDTQVATAGFYRLSWKTAEVTDVEVQEADNPDFNHASLRYQGPDDASVVSGKRNGDYYYRARVIGDQHAGAWSDTVKVTVAHHPLSRAFLFFGLGVTVFLATLFMVVHGTTGGRRERS